MTPAEEVKLSRHDATELGARVAWWLARESYGWSALDELIYYRKLPSRYGSERVTPELEARRLSWYPPAHEDAA